MNNRDELRAAVAKAIADVIGHGMREKCYAHADAALATFQGGTEGPVLMPRELSPEMAAGAAAAVWPVASREDCEKATKAALILLKTTMQPMPGATLEAIAAGIATMFPAYRAMIAERPYQRAEQGLH